MSSIFKVDSGSKTQILVFIVQVFVECFTDFGISLYTEMCGFEHVSLALNAIWISLCLGLWMAITETS